MARVRDEHKFTQSRDALLQVGLDLFIGSSFNCVGLNDILRKAEIPKGSFYHYFHSKEDFGLQVVQFYHDQTRELIEATLTDQKLSPYEQLKSFFEWHISRYDELGYCQGCLMGNLAQEVADASEAFRDKLKVCMGKTTQQIKGCISRLQKDDECSGGLCFSGLSPSEAAQILMNSWQGAMLQMKVEKSKAPLNLFMKHFFSD